MSENVILRGWHRPDEGNVGIPLYMDKHNRFEGLTKKAVARAHAADLKVQGKHGVKYKKYWFNEKTGEAICLVKAPNKEAVAKVLREAHGLVADELREVEEGA